ncbi:MAG: MotA/TolQ/ExbB proton channel family protein [Myxococcota bacterium]
MFSAEHLIELLIMGWISNIPLGIGSILTLMIFIERLWRFRGLEASARELAKQVIDKLVTRDLAGARSACDGSSSQLAETFRQALQWKNVALEDLERVMATSRAEIGSSLKKRIWIIGTTGSLAPFVGLFGTVVGIIRAFADMAEHGSGGFAVVAAGISEALIATALGLGVAIVALAFYNYLNVRIGALNATYARASEHFVQALLYVETQPTAEPGGEEVEDGRLSPA